MPRFKVTLSDGRVVTLESDTQPTEADVMLAIGQQSAPSPSLGSHPEAKISAGRHSDDFGGLPPSPDLEHRADANVFDVGGIGIAPETALMGVQAGRALIRPGLSLAARGGELVSQAAPIVKYYAVKKALQAIGIPGDVAELAAVGVSSYRKGGGPAKTPAPESPGAVSVEGFPRAGKTAAPDIVPQRPVRGQLTAAPVELPSGPDPSFVRGVRADVVQVPRKMLPAHPGELAAAPDPSYVRAVPAELGESVRFNPTKAIQSAREAFTAIGEQPRPAEASNAMELIRRGKSPTDAVAIVIKNRPAPVDPAAAFNARFGTLNDEQTRAALDLRNARGQIKSPSAETARSRR